MIEYIRLHEGNYNPLKEEHDIVRVEVGTLKNLGDRVDADTGTPVILKCGDTYLKISSSEWALIEAVEKPEQWKEKVSICQKIQSVS